MISIFAGCLTNHDRAHILHVICVDASTIAFQRDTIETLFILFISRKKTSHQGFLIALFRLQDVFSVALHLGGFLELVLGVEPATMGVVSILLADGARDDGLGQSR